MTGRRAPAVTRRQVTGWPAVALAGTAFIIVMLATTLPTPLYPLYQQTFSFGELMTTVIFAVYAIGVMAALVLTGRWSDQLGRKPMLRAGLALSATAALVFVLADSIGWLFAGRVASGLSAGIFTGTATAALVDFAPGPHKARAGLVAAVVNMGGLGLGPLLAGVLAQYAPAPLKLVYLVDLGLVAVAASAVEMLTEPVERAAAPKLRPQKLAVPAEVRAVFLRAAIAGFAGFAVLGLFTAVSPAFFGAVLHDTNRALVGVVVFALFASSTVGQTVSSRLGERHALIAGCGGLVAGMALIAGSLALASLPLLVTGAIVAGLAQGMGFRAGLTAVTVSAPAGRRAEITSTFFVVLYLGLILPVIGEGAAASAFGLVPSGIVFAGGVALLAIAVLALLVRSGATAP